VRRITLFFLTTVAAVAMLFGYRTSRGPTTPPSTAAAGAPVGVVSNGDPTQTTSGSTPGSTSGSTSGSSAAAPSASKNMTVNGTVAQTRWGPVQVQVIIANGKITDVKALQYPNGNGRDQEINSYALPQLHDEVISAQSAHIDGVSGATVTSDGYTQSLQAALDAAHFA
jgi:uncharacterized protein with FMN-binding domain